MLKLRHFCKNRGRWAKKVFARLQKILNREERVTMKKMDIIGKGAVFFPNRMESVGISIAGDIVDIPGSANSSSRQLPKPAIGMHWKACGGSAVRLFCAA